MNAALNRDRATSAVIVCPDGPMDSRNVVITVRANVFTDNMGKVLGLSERRPATRERKGSITSFERPCASAGDNSSVCWAFSRTRVTPSGHCIARQCPRHSSSLPKFVSACLGKQKLVFETAAMSDLETNSDLTAVSMSSDSKTVRAKTNKVVGSARSMNCGAIL